VNERFINTRKVVFGGYIAALVDDVSGHTAKTLLPDDKAYSTSELSVSFFRPALSTDGELLLEGFFDQRKPSYLPHRGDDQTKRWEADR
jgi:acyl-coenzyme A thioesterase PaaI-like protein